MTRQRVVEPSQFVEVSQHLLRRRGLIAGAAALITTAIASRVHSDDVAASDGETLFIGNSTTPPGFQSATHSTWLSTTVISSAPALRVTNAFGGTPDPNGDGIQGYTTGPINAGVFGRNNDLRGAGIWGEAPNGTGAFGDSISGNGVTGSSVSAAGVYAQSTSGSGVYGQSSTAFGILGVSSMSHGAVGLSYGGYGVVGASTAPGFGGCLGIANKAGAAGFVGSAPAGGYAAYLTGATVVVGDFVVASGSKSAAVKDASGTHRLVYCVESPESWFEDFGKGKLVNGRADVTLDTVFTEIVHTGDYHVHLTPQGDTNGLHVAHQTETGFSVAENKGGTSSVGFAWRLVAKRKDIARERLAKFALPKITIPDDSKLPKAPNPPLPTRR